MTIYTFGHGAKSFDKFIKTINDFKINLLVDIREKPISRYFPHFNKSNFEKEFSDRYMYAGDFLGGSAKFHNDLLEYIETKGICGDSENNRLRLIIDEDLRKRIFSSEQEFSNNNKRKTWITNNFLKHYIGAEKKERAINFLKENIFNDKNKSKNICFFCSEKDYRNCHRYILLENDWIKAMDPNIIVYHLEDIGSENYKQKNLF